MVMTDPIADMLTRLRNANSVYHEKVEIPGSKIKVAIANILKEEGFIKDFDFVQDSKQGLLRVNLKYGPNREKVITGIKRISKPGLRVYAKNDQLPRVLGGLGIAIVQQDARLIELHVKGALSYNASPEEIFEVMPIALLMDGAPALSQIPQLVYALEQAQQAEVAEAVAA